eukprot:2434400-Prymnesium_polylepis.1
MDGATASAVAVATHPTPMEYRLGSPPARRSNASMGEGRLTGWVQRLTAALRLFHFHCTKTPAAHVGTLGGRIPSRLH